MTFEFYSWFKRMEPIPLTVASDWPFASNEKLSVVGTFFGRRGWCIPNERTTRLATPGSPLERRTARYGFSCSKTRHSAPGFSTRTLRYSSRNSCSGMGPGRPLELTRHNTTQRIRRTSISYRPSLICRVCIAECIERAWILGTRIGRRCGSPIFGSLLDQGLSFVMVAVEIDGLLRNTPDWSIVLEPQPGSSSFAEKGQCG